MRKNDLDLAAIKSWAHFSVADPEKRILTSLNMEQVKMRVVSTGMILILLILCSITGPGTF